MSMVGQFVGDALLSSACRCAACVCVERPKTVLMRIRQPVYSLSQTPLRCAASSCFSFASAARWQRTDAV